MDARTNKIFNTRVILNQRKHTASLPEYVVRLPEKWMAYGEALPVRFKPVIKPKIEPNPYVEAILAKYCNPLPFEAFKYRQEKPVKYRPNVCQPTTLMYIKFG